MNIAWWHRFSAPTGRCDRLDHAQAGRPRLDQRVPQSSLRIAENTSSETVREFWHGTGLINEYSRAACPPEDSQVISRNLFSSRTATHIGPLRGPGATPQPSSVGHRVEGRTAPFQLHDLGIGQPFVECSPVGAVIEAAEDSEA